MYFFKKYNPCYSSLVVMLFFDLMKDLLLCVSCRSAANFIRAWRLGELVEITRCFILISSVALLKIACWHEVFYVFVFISALLLTRGTLFAIDRF